MSVCVIHSIQRGAKLQHKHLEDEISQSCDCLLEVKRNKCNTAPGFKALNPAKLLFISKCFW